MEKFRGTVVTTGIFVAFITFAVTVFFMPPQRALSLGILMAAIFIFVVSLITDISLRKYRNLDNAINQDIILKNSANYYAGQLIGNGLLYLTKDRLIFLFFNKRKLYREDIPFTDIKRATYGALFRNVLGLKLFMSDSSIKGFVIKDIEQFLEHINQNLASGHGSEPDSVQK